MVVLLLLVKSAPSSASNLSLRVSLGLEDPGVWVLLSLREESLQGPRKEGRRKGEERDNEEEEKKESRRGGRRGRVK